MMPHFKCEAYLSCPCHVFGFGSALFYNVLMNGTEEMCKLGGMLP